MPALKFVLFVSLVPIPRCALDFLLAIKSPDWIVKSRGIQSPHATSAGGQNAPTQEHVYQGEQADSHAQARDEQRSLPDNATKASCTTGTAHSSNGSRTTMHTRAEEASLSVTDGDSASVAAADVRSTSNSSTVSNDKKSDRDVQGNSSRDGNKQSSGIRDPDGDGGTSSGDANDLRSLGASARGRIPFELLVAYVDERAAVGRMLLPDDVADRLAGEVRGIFHEAMLRHDPHRCEGGRDVMPPAGNRVTSSNHTDEQEAITEGDRARAMATAAGKLPRTSIGDKRFDSEGRSERRDMPAGRWEALMDVGAGGRGVMVWEGMSDLHAVCLPLEALFLGSDDSGGGRGGDDEEEQHLLFEQLLWSGGGDLRGQQANGASAHGVDSGEQPGNGQEGGRSAVGSAGSTAVPRGSSSWPEPWLGQHQASVSRPPEMLNHSKNHSVVSPAAAAMTDAPTAASVGAEAAAEAAEAMVRDVSLSQKLLPALLCARDRLQAVLRGAADATGRQDLAEVLRTRLLLKAAKAMGCGKVVVGETATRLAARIIADVAKGRGFGLPADLAVWDDREGWGERMGEGPKEASEKAPCSLVQRAVRPAPVVIRPLRDCLLAELAMHCQLAGLRTVFVPNLHTSGGVGARARGDNRGVGVRGKERVGARGSEVADMEDGGLGRVGGGGGAAAGGVLTKEQSINDIASAFVTALQVRPLVLQLGNTVNAAFDVTFA